jgi:hypothetical protein
MQRCLIFCALALATAGPAVEAHHSIAGAYDSGRQVRVDGVVTQFEFVSPHPFVSIQVRDGRAAGEWRLEMDNRRELQSIGFDEDTLKAGDRIIVTGSLSRREPNRLYIQRLDRPADGFGYEQVNSRPRLRAR